MRIGRKRTITAPVTFKRKILPSLSIDRGMDGLIYYDSDSVLQATEY